MREFGEAQPQIELDLASLSWGEGAGELGDGTVDVAVVRLPVGDPSLESQVVFEERARRGARAPTTRSPAARR